MRNKFWRLRLARNAVPDAFAESSPLAMPVELVAKLAPNDGIIMASWDEGALVGRVHALGVVEHVNKADRTATVSWRRVNFALSPSPQGHSKWRDMPFFKFDCIVAERYKLLERFTIAFAGEDRIQAAAPEPPTQPGSSMNSTNLRSTPATVSKSSPTQGVPDPDRSSPLCNRVAPNGRIFATAARGTFMGNRADPARWLVCDLHFERTPRAPRKYTKLFFLDEAVALAAGHRPCKTCRRQRYQDYLAAVANNRDISGAPELDRQLKVARNAPYTVAPIRSLSDGVFVSLGDNDFRVVWHGALHKWTPEGYVDPVAIEDVSVDSVSVVTPRPSVMALRHGYPVAMHSSVETEMPRDRAAGPRTRDPAVDVSNGDRQREFDDVLLERIRAVIRPGDEIHTLTSKRPNKIVAIDSAGIEVETLRTDERGSGPQLVPAWMITVGWEHLVRTGQLSQNELLNDLNVKRSAFVCALLSRFRDVDVRAAQPTVLELVRD